MRPFSRPLQSYLFPAALAGALVLGVRAAPAADEEAPKGPAVTVLKAAKSCFSDIVEATGTIIIMLCTMDSVTIHAGTGPPIRWWPPTCP